MLEENVIKVHFNVNSKSKVYFSLNGSVLESTTVKLMIELTVMHSAQNFFKMSHDPKIVKTGFCSNGLILGSFESQRDGPHRKW